MDGQTYRLTDGRGATLNAGPHNVRRTGAVWSTILCLCTRHGSTTSPSGERL